jgi:hypothetical protein
MCGKSGNETRSFDQLRTCLRVGREDFLYVFAFIGCQSPVEIRSNFFS